MSGSARSSSYEPYARGMSSSAATAAARPGSRDAIASTEHRAAPRIPGMTFFRPMFAVDRIPQRIAVIAILATVLTPGRPPATVSHNHLEERDTNSCAGSAGRPRPSERDGSPREPEPHRPRAPSAWRPLPLGAGRPDRADAERDPGPHR